MCTMTTLIFIVIKLVAPTIISYCQPYRQNSVFLFHVTKFAVMSSLIRNVKNLNIPVINCISKKVTPSLSSIEYANINPLETERTKSDCTSRSKSLPPIPISFNDSPYKPHTAQDVLMGCGSAIRNLIVSPHLVPPTFKIMAKRWFSQKSKSKGKGRNSRCCQYRTFS
ncbi:uncharacterized protein LOC143192666 [Rhynchophorus ferrugineus]|uniref:uncharacterized protein LOC143192666 n=1 Tax=Rhynchophorus ferrugineus TaxID=354439 RepID=UPI003FCC27A2